MSGPIEQAIAEMAPELLGWARRGLPGGAGASDVVQETIGAAIEKVAVEELAVEDWDRARARRYTFGIFKNMLAGSLRSARRRPTVAVAEVRAIDPGRTPSSLIVAEERSARVTVALNRLGDRERDVLLWRVEGLTYAEIGERLGISHQAARKAFAKAGVKFKEHYGPDSGAA